MNIIFFGSTSDSVLVLEQLTNPLPVAIITQPPKPVGRKKIMTPTPVEMWAKSHDTPVLSFPTNPEKSWMYENEQTVIDALEPFKADLLVSASYGQKIPSVLIKNAKCGGLNVHPSILPRWRGADPVPWAILTGDHQIGVSVVTLEDKFDQGKIIAQKKIPVENTDTSDPLRTKLFELGAKLLTDALPDYLSGKNKGHPQPATRNPQPYPYARKFTRDDGFVPWELLQAAINIESGIMNHESREKITLEQYGTIPIVKDYLKYHDPTITETSVGTIIERFFRALTPWPGLWTKIRIMNLESGIMEEKRLKIVSCHLQPTTNNLQLDSVQLEGKTPVSFTQFMSAYHPR